MPSVRRLAGVACGSGGEGITLVLLEVEGVGLNLTARMAHFVHRVLPRDGQDFFGKLQRCSALPDKRDCAVWQRALGETAAAALLQLLATVRWEANQIQAVGCLGPILWHEPDGKFTASLDLPLTAVIAERTGLTTVSEFRARDVVLGGQGMPITPLADWLLYRRPHEDQLLIHLGGDAGLVYLPAGGKFSQIIGFEAGPCNRLLDGLIRHWSANRERFDPGGKHAVQGRCLEKLLERWLVHPYLSRKPPKSLPRSEFATEFIEQAGKMTQAENGALQDLLCTANHFISRVIVEAAKRWIPLATESDRPVRIRLSGGGIRNGLLWRLLEQRFTPHVLGRLDELGTPAQARHAAGAALLAALALDGVPAGSASWTGANGIGVLGQFTPGRTRHWQRCLAWMSAQQSLPGQAAA